MRKSLALVGLPLFLSACGLPPAISVASWALDGVSYVVSGKSVTDHAISEVAQRDCALLRVVQGREICESENAIDAVDDDALVMVAAAPSGDNWFAGAEVLPPADPIEVPVEIAGFVQGFGPGVVAVDEAQPAAAFVPAAAAWVPADVAPSSWSAEASPKERPAAPIRIGFVEMHDAVQETRETVSGPLNSPETQMVVVVGSFRSIGNAWSQAGRFAALDARVRSDRIDGRTWHRVVVDAPLQTVQRMGAEDAWLLRVCTGNGGLPPCGPLTVSSAGTIAPQTVN
jgi:hypothetical protein